MQEQDGTRSFEHEILRHLDAAYNLARWLTRNDQEAQDVVQEAFLRALRFYESFRGGDARSWVLKIVRNTFYTSLRKHRAGVSAAEFDENLLGPDPHARSPEEALLRDSNSELLRKALDELPPKFREVLVLRELEEMSYKEISQITGLPPGTVMSSLSRARGRLRLALTNLMDKHRSPGTTPALRSQGQEISAP